jgi:hypothetical protein
MTFTTHETAKYYRLTRDELRVHLVNSGDPFPDETISQSYGSRIGINTSGGHVSADAGFFWLRTRTLRIPFWGEDQ